MVNTGIHKIPCGRYIRDEFHQDPSINNLMMGWARELILERAKQQPFATPRITQMSGAPIRLGAKDWVGNALLWSLCVLLNTNDIALPQGVTTADLGNYKKWLLITSSVHDMFRKNHTQSALIDMTAQWRKKLETMKGR